MSSNRNQPSGFRVKNSTLTQPIVIPSQDQANFLTTYDEHKNLVSINLQESNRPSSVNNTSKPSSGSTAGLAIRSVASSYVDRM